MTALDDATARNHIVEAAHSLFERGLTHGRTGNLSIRTGEGILVTPTGCSLGSVKTNDLTALNAEGCHVSGPPASKEAFLHLAMLRARPDTNAVVHTHSTYSAAVSCLGGLDPGDALPPLTAYFAMRVGRLALLPYFAPGDPELGPAAETAAREGPALLLRNHGPIVAGRDLAAALDAVEELEQTAKLFLILRGHDVQPLTAAQAEALRIPA